MPAPRATPAPQATPPALPTSSLPRAATGRPTAARHHARHRDHGHVYVVRSGDSLWTIARHQLGADASDARIAREVQRLWRLNADRIASGRPDLITPGERLVV